MRKIIFGVASRRRTERVKRSEKTDFQKFHDEMRKIKRRGFIVHQSTGLVEIDKNGNMSPLPNKTFTRQQAAK